MGSAENSAASECETNPAHQWHASHVSDVTMRFGLSTHSIRNATPLELKQGLSRAAMKVKTAIKTAGLSFAGYALASMFADKIPLNPMASQLAGFAGAFLGTLVAPRRDRARGRQNGAEKKNGAASAAAGAGGSVKADAPPVVAAEMPAERSRSAGTRQT